MLIFITAASLIGLGLYGIDDLKKMNENTRSLYADRVVCMQQLANVRFEYMANILPVAQNVRNHVITFDEAEKKVRKAGESINTNWQKYKLSYLTPEEQLLVKQTEVVKIQADQSVENLSSILSKKDTAALAAFVKNQPPNEAAPIIINMTMLMELQARVARQIFNNNQDIYGSTSKRFVLLILLSLVIALSLSYYIIRNIKNLIKDRLKSIDTVKESEVKYRSLLENASDAIYLEDRQGNFTEVNERMCQMTGYSKDELLKLNVEEIIDPDQ